WLQNGGSPTPTIQSGRGGLPGAGSGPKPGTGDAGAARGGGAAGYIAGRGPGGGAPPARLTGGSNHFLLLTIDNTLELFRKQGGAFTLLVSAPLPAPLVAGSTHRLEIHAMGSLLEGFWDGVKLLQATDAFNQTATRHGLDWNSSF